MSTDKQTTAEPSSPLEQWVEAHVADADTRSVCERCGGHVSRQWIEVMGTEDDRALACPRCTKQLALFRGAASNPDYEPDNGEMASHTRHGDRDISGGDA